MFAGPNHEEAISRMKRENQGWATSPEENEKSQNNNQVLWEAVDDTWQQDLWASPEESKGLEGPPVAIGEEVDWGQVSESSWGGRSDVPGS